MIVKPIKASEAYPWLLEKHYAKRIPPISYAFGVFGGDDLNGVVTFGVPSSSPLRAGVCGPEHSSIVLELNRIWCSGDETDNNSLILRR